MWTVTDKVISQKEKRIFSKLSKISRIHKYRNLYERPTACTLLILWQGHVRNLLFFFNLAGCEQLGIDVTYLRCGLQHNVFVIIKLIIVNTYVTMPTYCARYNSDYSSIESSLILVFICSWKSSFQF